MANESIRETEKNKLTSARVREMDPREDGKDRFVWDTELPGFCVRIRPSGFKAYWIRFRNDRQKQCWVSVGECLKVTAEQARKVARERLGAVSQGEDPAKARDDRKVAVTVSELADRFIEEHIGAKITMEGDTRKIEMIRDKDGKPIGNKQSTAMEHIRLIERNIRPALGKMTVKEIGTSEVAAMLFKIRKDHPTLSNRIRSVLSKMFAKAELWEYIPRGSNPARGHTPAPSVKKDRNLNDREIFALGDTLRATEEATFQARIPASGKRSIPKRKPGEAKAEDPYAIAALRLAILAGMRKSEIIGDRYRGMPALTWEDVDLSAGVLSVHHKTETKTGKKRIVHLCTAAQRLLENLPHQLGNPHVIPGEIAGHSLVNLQAVWDRIRDLTTERARVAAMEAGQKALAVDISDVTIHDLRRTFASVGAGLGYPELWLSGLLGHSAATVTQGYARVNQDPLRVAVEAIGGRIAGLLDGSIALDKEAEERHEVRH